MNRRFKLLPFTMFAVLMLLAVRMADLVRGGEEFSRMLLVGSVQAETEKPAPETSAEPKKEDAKAPAGEAPKEEKKESVGDKQAVKEEPKVDVPKVEEKKDEDKKEEDKKTEEKKEDEAKKDGEGKEAKEESGHGEEGEGKKKPKKGGPPQGKVSEEPPKEEAGAGKGLTPQARYFSPVELDILQNLGKRREQLMGWDKEVEVKENLLANVEKRIEEKLVQIQTMRKELDGMLVQYNEQEDAKIRSLVKIYENMKPRDAARIFDEVEMPILLLVIDRMAEKKAAPILASMDSKKAKQLTVELAEQRRLQNKAPAAPPASR